MNEIKSNICESVKIDDYEYIISYIDIENFSFVKRIEIRDNRIENKLICIRTDRNGNLEYGCLNPDNNSELVDVQKLDDDKKIVCQEILSQFGELVHYGKYSDDACKVFYEVKEKFENKKVK